MKEDDDPEKLPCFGASLDESEIQKKDDLELEAERLFSKKEGSKPRQTNNDSFSNIQAAEDLSAVVETD